MEEWRDITGYEGYYQVSSKGNVQSLDRALIDSTGVTRRIKGKQVTPFITNIGYVQVRLMKNGKQKHMYVHRLVSKEFIKNPIIALTDVRFDTYFLHCGSRLLSHKNIIS